VENEIGLMGSCTGEGAGTGPSVVEPDGCPSVSLPAPDLDVDCYGGNQLGSHVGLKGVLGPLTTLFHLWIALSSI
jgi:hypothetical protein